MDSNRTRTSIMVDKTQYDEFRKNTLINRLTLHALLDKAMKLYNSDENFRKIIEK